MFAFPPAVPAVYNTALFSGAAYVMATLATVTANRVFGWEPSRRSAIAAGLVASASLAGVLSLESSLAVSLLFCVSTACIPFAALHGARVLAAGSLNSLPTIAFAAGALASAADAAVSAALAETMLVIAAALPALSAALFVACEGSPAGSHAETRPSNDARPVPRDALAKLPWIYVFPLLLGCLVSSFYIGITFVPYAISSTAIWQYSSLIVVVLFAAPLAAKVVVRRPFSDGTAGLYLVVLLAVLLAGLFLISTSMIYLILPLGMIIAANEAMLALAFVTGIQVASSRELPFTPMFALFELASGCIWMTCVGIAANNVGGTDFAGLMAVATVCIIAIAVLYLAFLLIAIRRFAPMAVKQSAPRKGGAQDENPTHVRGSLPQTECMQAGSGQAASAQDRPDESGEAGAGGLGATSSPSGAGEPHAHEGDLDRHLEAWLAQFDLTLREREVARCIIDGLAFRVIANTLEISERTAKFHASSIYRKMGIGSRNELSAAWTLHMSEKRPPGN